MLMLVYRSPEVAPLPCTATFCPSNLFLVKQVSMIHIKVIADAPVAEHVLIPLNAEHYAGFSPHLGLLERCIQCQWKVSISEVHQGLIRENSTCRLFPVILRYPYWKLLSFRFVISVNKSQFSYQFD